MIAILGVCSQWCFIEACRRISTPLIAPLDYTRIVYAGVIGYIFFHELPSLFEVTGMLVILASTLFITVLKSKQSNTRTHAPVFRRLGKFIFQYCRICCAPLCAPHLHVFVLTLISAWTLNWYA